MLIGIEGLFGFKALVFQIAYSLVGIAFIEMINYVEHYGLMRKKDKRGIWEPVTE
jgi:alkane 1-monooxygenase